MHGATAATIATCEDGHQVTPNSKKKKSDRFFFFFFLLLFVFNKPLFLRFVLNLRWYKIDGPYAANRSERGGSVPEMQGICSAESDIHFPVYFGIKADDLSTLNN